MQDVNHSPKMACVSTYIRHRDAVSDEVFVTGGRLPRGRKNCPYPGFWKGGVRHIGGGYAVMPRSYYPAPDPA